MLTWDPARHALGVAEMDGNHREFLALLGLLNEAGDGEFPALFQRLVDHTRLHFAEEGRLMRQCRFAALGEHEGEHHRLVGELLQFNRNVRRGRLSLARAYVRVGLPEWFALHLDTMDAALAARCRQVRAAATVLED
jgi:hemerythrin